MNVISPINDKRKRAFDGRIIEDGEELHFNIVAVRDGAPGANNTVYLTDTDRLTRDAARSRALAAGRFDEVRADVRDEYIERLTGKASNGGSPAPTSDSAAQAMRDDARATYIRDQLRHSRYQQG